MPKPHDDKTIIDPLRWQYWNDLKGTRFFFGSIFWQQRKNEFFSINKRQFSICKKWLIVHSWQDHRYMKMYWILSTKNRFSNPAHQSFTIKDAKDIHQIERIDLSGKLVLKGTRMLIKYIYLIYLWESIITKAYDRHHALIGRSKLVIDWIIK